MKYKIKHLAHSIEGDVLFLYGYDSSGRIAFSVNCQDEVQYSPLEIIDEMFVMIGQYKIMSAYMCMFLINQNEPFIETIEDNSNDAEKGSEAN